MKEDKIINENLEFIGENINVITLNRQGNLKEEFKKVLKCPELYTGKNRFDYLIIFLRAYFDCNWNSDYDIQKWLLINESIILPHSVTLTGWVLLQMYFGNRDVAIEKFRKSVDDISFTSNEIDVYIPSLLIYDIYSYYKYPTLRKNKGFIYEKSIFNLRAVEIINNYKGFKKSYENIIQIVERMIKDNYDDLHIFIHYQTYFFQIRFIYLKEGKEWVDVVDLKNQDNYYFDLIILHAYAELLQKENHKSNIVSIHLKNNEIKINIKKTKDIWRDIFNNDSDISFADKNTLNMQYLNWKNEILVNSR